MLTTARSGLITKLEGGAAGAGHTALTEDMFKSTEDTGEGQRRFPGSHRSSIVSVERLEVLSSSSTFRILDMDGFSIPSTDAESKQWTELLNSSFERVGPIP
jgi:hypothetical protein